MPFISLIPKLMISLGYHSHYSIEYYVLEENLGSQVSQFFNIGNYKIIIFIYEA